LLSSNVFLHQTRLRVIFHKFNGGLPFASIMVKKNRKSRFSIVMLLVFYNRQIKNKKTVIVK